jgi:hypothetical protein
MGMAGARPLPTIERSACGFLEHPVSRRPDKRYQADVGRDASVSSREGGRIAGGGRSTLEA